MEAKDAELEVEGFYSRYSMPVRYLVDEGRVFFCCLKPVKCLLESDVGQVVEAIARSEGLDWRLHLFHEFHTPLGYPYLPENDIKLFLLRFCRRSSRPHVESWIPLNPEALFDISSLLLAKGDEMA